MIEFTLRVDVKSPDDEDEQIPDEHLIGNFRWQTIPRIGETVVIEGYDVKVNEVSYAVAAKPHIMIFVEVDGSLFTHLRSKKPWISNLN